MMDSATYLVTREIAERSGLIETRYRTTDGRFILNDRDLARIRFSADEYISGLTGVEKVTSQEAKTLIAQNNYQLGLPKEASEEQANDETEMVVKDEATDEDVADTTDKKEENIQDNDEKTEE